MTESKHTKGQRWVYCGQDAERPCQCGCIWDVEADYPVAKVIRGEWGDTYPAIKIIKPGAIGAVVEPYVEKIVYGSVSEEAADAHIRLMVKAPEMCQLMRDIVSDEIGLTADVNARVNELLAEIDA